MRPPSNEHFELVRESLRQRPNDPTLLCELGCLYHEAGNAYQGDKRREAFNSAIVLFRHAAEQNNPTALFLLANLLDSDEYEGAFPETLETTRHEAEALYRRVIQEFPNSNKWMEAKLNLGQRLARDAEDAPDTNEKRREARELFVAVIASQAHRLMGMAELELETLEQEMQSSPQP